eukprot:CAMPEP_0204324582 /NCGR_PEP_ID=MMETSP0469-20131031/10358_1 /ASSEMBLY_ACC=CAM_ASM_000384 /TAXON_ID=2969 /ORGANISM="Oxyrrhis marina" /LENGTH=40 /DNA_ID= /DNA_START= /DNA_END= /DNA_ORIENTATION=
MAPSSKFAVIRWHVTPVSTSPSKIVWNPEKHPRCLGSSDG